MTVGETGSCSDGLGHTQFSSVSSVAQSCLILCDPMNRSTPGLPVHHQLPEFTHVHQVGDAIQTFHPLLSPSPPAPIPPSIRVFSNESTLRMRWPKYWSFSFSIIMDWFKIGKGVQQSCTLFACLTYMQSTSCNNIQKNCTKKVFTTQIIMV